MLRAEDHVCIKKDGVKLRTLRKTAGLFPAVFFYIFRSQQRGAGYWAMN